MSDQEKHEIIGRTTLELKERRSHLAALDAKAREYADSMRIVAQDLFHVGVTYTGSGSTGSMDTPARALGKYPDRSAVVALKDEIESTRARIETLAKSLQEMGA